MLYNKNVVLFSSRINGETAADNGFRAILLDVEGYREEKDFFRQCCSAIQEELGTGKGVLTTLSERLSRLLRGDGG